MTSRITTLLLAVTLLAASATPSPQYTPYPVAPTARDGRSDFNFAYGTWRTHYRILKDRLAGSHEWYECRGTSVFRPFWHGSGNLEDAEIRCPNRHIVGMTLRFYDAQTHQWSLWWGTQKLGIPPPPQVGHFESNGTGDFYAYDRWKGTPVICRFHWANVNGNIHFEQAYSTDGGRSWEVNWITDTRRASSSSKGVWNATAPSGDGHNGFDFLIGTWRTHSIELRHPLRDDRDRFACDGTSTVRTFWGGSADIEDDDLHCPAQHRVGVTVRLYDPVTHRWSLYSGTQKLGLALRPQAGTFGADGTGDFFGHDTLDGKPIVVRYRWARRDGNPRLEEAFSADDGTTWQTVRTTGYERVRAVKSPPGQ
jgi:hypothetical protein